jgi:hypothetical protein
MPAIEHIFIFGQWVDPYLSKHAGVNRLGTLTPNRRPSLTHSVENIPKK